jgi:hypothetical protein
MNLEDIKESKAALEKRVMAELVEFMKSTGLTVSEMYLVNEHALDTEGHLTNERLFKVRIKLEI